MSRYTVLGALALALGLGLSAPWVEVEAAPDEAPGAITGVSAWLNVEREEGAEEPAFAEDGAVDFHALEGKVVVVEFWATWCPPCRESIPHLNELHAEHADDGLVVLSLTGLDRRQDEATVRRFVADQIDYPVGLLTSHETFHEYQVTGIPHAVIVGRDGKVAWKGHPLDSRFGDEVAAALAASRS